MSKILAVLAGMFHSKGTLGKGAADGKEWSWPVEPEPNIKLQPDLPHPFMFKVAHQDGPKVDGEQKRPQRFAPNGFEAKRNRR